MIKNNRLNIFLSTLNFIMAMIGYQLFTSIVGQDFDYNTQTYTIPFRMAQVILMFGVIALNLKSTLILTLEIKIFLVFYLFVLGRFVFDYYIMKSYLILPEMGNKIILMAFFLTLIQLISILVSLPYIKFSNILFWLYLISSLCIILTFFNNESFLEQTVKRLGGNEALGSIATGHLGLTNLILGYCYYQKYKNKYIGILVLAFSLVAMLVLMRAGSRGSVLSLIIVASFYIFAKSKKKLLGIFIIIILSIIAYLTINYIQNIIEEISPILKERIFDREDALSDRRYHYNLGLSYFYEKPFFGKQFALPEGIYPHNIFVEVLMQTGIIGFFIFSFLLIRILYKCLIIIKNRPLYIWMVLIFIQNFALLLTSGSYVTSSIFCILLCLISIIGQTNVYKSSQLSARRLTTIKL